MTSDPSASGPLVSVIVPMLNEERDIEACLASIFAQDYAPELVEVIVVDGGSRDRSRDLATAALARSAFARAELLSNPAGNTPSNLNRGLENAGGEIVVRVDVRSLIPSHYLTRVVEVLEKRLEVMVVGGAQIPRARPGSGLVGQAIARALRNPYLTGLSRYRRRASSGPTDTVYLGAFRRADLQGLGGWNEAWATNQDYELNRRMSRLGTVWFESALAVGYRPRESFGDLVSQYRRFGRWKAASWLETGAVSGRHASILGGAALGLFLVPRWLLRRPARRGAIAAAAALALESTVGEPGSFVVRILSVGASGASIAAWLMGVFEQIVRFALGERLILGQSGRA